jgi:hypothetical protein
LDAKELDLLSPETVAQVRGMLLLDAAQPPSTRNEFNRLASCHSKYVLTDPKEFALDRQHECWNALASPNHVVLRGVYALIKSDMLSCHYEFSEEAVHALYIALDAEVPPKCAAVNDFARPGANATRVDFPIFTDVFERVRTFANN